MEYHFTAQNFDKEVLQSPEPVLIDFYADWCGPCKMMAPVVDKMAEELEGKVKVGKINVDEEPELAEKYHVVSIPTFVILKDGAVKETCVGALSATQLMEKVKQVLA
ncbi:MAG TPA: thioredoxin [Lachnospiraceae bacterium]|nr:thioredoxin [Lachnospiraceae bacterium]